VEHVLFGRRGTVKCGNTFGESVPACAWLGPYPTLLCPTLRRHAGKLKVNDATDEALATLPQKRPFGELDLLV